LAFSGVSAVSAETIRTAIPSATIHYLSLYVAEERGFFKDENLQNEVVAIGDAAGITALVNGGIDFSGAVGSGMRAAMTAAPIKVIMFQTDRVTWYVITGAQIAHISDLNGKRSQ
jgi:ABC-type nitrate/sulfonate/bicarbonate transport system substrate-binding protein